MKNPFRTQSLVLSAILFVSFAGQVFGDEIEKGLQTRLEQSRAFALTIQNKLKTGASVSSELSGLKAVAEDIKISNLLLEERFTLRAGKVKSLGAKAIDRHEAMVEGYRKALTECLSLIDSLPTDGSIPQSAIRKLQSLLNKLLPKRGRPIIGSLPYKHLKYPTIEPSVAPEITPAYKGGNKTVSPDDIKSTPEAPLSKEIAALAQSLNWQPVAEYEYVKNSIETEWYWGCQKGAEETLRQKSGNDCDQALLLASLLKASGFPTRIVRGNIQFFAGGKNEPINTVKNITGIADPNKIAEFFQKAGIPYKPIIAGGKISNFQIDHVFVESQIPYANYRGAVLDDNGKVWLGLDTSIKAKGYTDNGASDIMSAMSLSTVRDEYLGLATTATPSTPFESNQRPLEYLQSRINSELRTQNSELAYADFLRTRTLLPEVLNILPSGTQFTLIKATNEYTSIPGELLHKVKFTAVDANKNELFSITLPLFQLSNKQIAFTYEAETVEDQELIDSYGGLDSTPGYLVRLRPVLTINKERIVVATDGLPMGADYNLRIDLYSPSVNEGATPAETITNTMITGNLAEIGITAGRAVLTPSPLAGEGGGEGNKDAERMLYEATNHYIDLWNQAEEELASLFHLAIARPLPAIVTIGGVIDVAYLLDIPHGFTWKGVFVDANLRRVETVGSAEFGVGSEGERERLFMRLSSLQGSILENRVFEDDFKVESISTAKLFQIVNQGSVGGGQGSRLLKIDKTNIDAILPALLFDDNIKEDIKNSVNQGFELRTLNSELVFKDWTGVGYLKEKTETGESGWMLSGMIAGGASTVAPDQWVDQEIASKLKSSFTQSNSDPLAAASIVIVAPTNYQDTKVNTKTPEKIWVLVRDSKYLPVKGATVTFEVQAGGGYLGDIEGTTTGTATTDYKGVAKISFTAGKHTYDNPVMAKINPTDEKYTQVGDNFITAWAAASSGKVSLNKSFQIYGVPDVPDHFRYMSGDGNSGLVNTAAGSLAVLVEDQYDNPLSNKTVSFTVTSAKPVDGSVTLPQPPQTYRSLQLYTRESCPQSPYITYPDCKTALKTSLTVTSEAIGMAMTESMFGDTLGTEYTVDIATTAFPPKLPLVENPLTIHLYTGGKWKEGLYIAPYLQASMYETSGNHGGITDGAKVKTELSQPMKVQIILSRPGYSVESASGVPYLRGTGLFAAEPVTNAILTATTITGGAIPTPVENGHDNGIYEFKIKMGNYPEKNIIEITGSAPVKVPHIAESDLKENISLNLPIGKDICFKHSAKDTGDRCDWGDQQTLRQWALPPKKTFTSVLPEVATPPILLLDDNGLLAQDVTLQYSIKPTDYTASQAYLVIYEDNEIFRYAFASVQGTGSLILSKGSKFDSTKNYTAELILNYGSDIEMRSDKKTITVANIAVKDGQFMNPKTAEEIKFGDGSKSEKQYRIELTSKALASSCSNLTGKIQLVLANGQTVSVPGAQDEYYKATYPLEIFTLLSNKCGVRVNDGTGTGKDKFIVSNLSKNTLAARNNVPSDTAVLYGGIGSKLLIEINGAKKTIPVEPVGVIVLGIDGLRQDVLYTVEEQHVNELHVNYYVQPSELKGLCDVLGGKPGGIISTTCDATGWESKHVKLKDVTAIFPSITLASWASIFTGKMPNETGITGNEYYARDLAYSEPARFNKPMGMITYDSGAFKGYDAFPKTSMLLDDDFLIPSRENWRNAVDPLDTPQNGRLMLSADTIFETITGRTEGLGLPALPGMTNVITYYQDKGGDPVAVANNHYARGARWMTWRLDLSSGIRAILDQQSWTRFMDYLEGHYKDEAFKRNTVPFSALTVWYLPGLDHIAHEEGMGAYTDYFKKETDEFIRLMVEELKSLDEFNNKIFVIVADHGHTAMPTGMKVKAKQKDIDPELGTTYSTNITFDAETSCKFKTNFIDPSDPNHPNVAKLAEQANNNLHIWELGEMFSAFGGIEGASVRTKYKLLVPGEIETIFVNSEVSGEISPTSDIGKADIVAALNGPMAHIYSMIGTDNATLGEIAEALKIMYSGIYSDEASQWYGFADLEDYLDFRKPIVGRLGKSIDKILIRLEDDKYYVFEGLDDNGDPITYSLSTSFAGIEYVDAENRVNGMNNKNRSGDIVLLMKDNVYFPDNESIADHRYTSGVACKSWHGSLNRSDSYVPFIFAYPGGNSNELERILKRDTLCKSDYSECKANWKLTDIVKEIISTQYKY